MQNDGYADVAAETFVQYFNPPNKFNIYFMPVLGGELPPQKSEIFFDTELRQLVALIHTRAGCAATGGSGQVCYAFDTSISKRHRVSPGVYCRRGQNPGHGINSSRF